MLKHYPPIQEAFGLRNPIKPLPREVQHICDAIKQKHGESIASLKGGKEIKTLVLAEGRSHSLRAASGKSSLPTEVGERAAEEERQEREKCSYSLSMSKMKNE